MEFDSDVTVQLYDTESLTTDDNTPSASFSVRTSSVWVPEDNGPTCSVESHPDQLDWSSEYWKLDVSGSAVLANAKVAYALVDDFGGVVTNDGVPGGRPNSYHDSVDTVTCDS